MTTFLKLVVLTTCLVSTSFGAPQLFPFSNLRTYFDHQIKDGPGAKTDGSSAMEDASQEQTQIVEIPVLLKDGTKYDSFPKNHKPAQDDSSYKPAEAAAVVDFNPSFPSQRLRAPAIGEPVNYATLLEAQNSKQQVQLQEQPIPPATVLLPPTTADYPATVQFLPPVPSQELQTPPLPQGAQLPTSSQTPETYNVLIEPSATGIYKPVKNTKNTNQNSYPKKYRPENHKYPPTGESGSDFNGKKKIQFPKKEHSKHSKEQEIYKQQQKEQQNVAATVEAASFQKEVLSQILPSRKGSGSDEQVAAESGFSSISAGAGGHGLGLGGGGSDGGGDRVEFQMHGQHGPHSYKWGYDTGKGHNRQFRYEERDNDGHVKGHYGFYDKSGKLQVVNYSADPHSGFHADGNFGKHSIA